MTPAYRYRAHLVRVIDGDTYVLDVDLGFRVHSHVTVRLRGLDCPEPSTAEGRRAAAAALVFLGTGPLIVESYKDAQSFARWVCDVWVGDQLLADMLRKDGHAKR